MPKANYKKLSNEDRERIVEAYINGSNATSIAKVLCFNERTVQSIVKKYIDGEDYRRKPKIGERGYTKKTMPEPQRKLIQSWIDEDCNLSIKGIVKRFQDEMGLKVSWEKVKKNLKNFNYSFIRIDPPLQNNDMSTLGVRASYANIFINNVLKFIDTKVVFVNEDAFNVTTRVNKSVAEKGEKEKLKVRPFKKVVSMCCAMNKHGILGFHTQLRRYTAESYKNFVESVVTKLTKTKISEAIIIMNSECTDKYPSIKALIESKGHTLIRLPPNSSFLNPIEGIYTKWIELIREKDPQSDKELFELIDTIFSKITGTDCSRFFEHTLSYLPKCLNREEIFD